MGLQWEQLKALYKKDWLIRWRHWFTTLLELFLPILLVWSQAATRNQTSSTTKFHSSFLDSGLLPNTNRFICSTVGSKIFYSPATGESKRLIGDEIESCQIQATGFSNISEMIKAWGDQMVLQSDIIHGVNFDHLDITNKQANYTIYLQNLPYSGAWKIKSSTSFEPYIYTQSVINLLLTWYPESTSFESFEYDYTDQLFPEGNPVFNNDKESSNSDVIIDGSTPDTLDFYSIYFYLELGFLFMTSIITRRIVKEKSTQGKELLRIMGMTDTVYWISQFINYFTLSIFHATLITVFYAHYFDINPFSNFNSSLFFATYLMCAVSTILFTFSITTIINRPVIGVLISMTARATLSYAATAAKKSNMELLGISVKAWSCLVPNAGLYWSIYDLMLLGSTNQAFWSNLFTPVNTDETVALGYVFLVTIFSWIIYILLTWYLDAVWPFQAGTPKPWYFPMTLFPARKKNTFNIHLLHDHSKSKSNSESESSLHEPLSPGLEASIQCKNVYRSFGHLGSRKTVVNGLDLNIMKGQITALLGHNGAGKTTTMNMITGILPPSSGIILVNGIDVHRNVVIARRSLALCPQTDLLIEELTVKQNLELCAGLRGLAPKKKQELIPLNIARVNLTNKTYTLAKNLSGGMRRRLQLALALSTASDILILDEPTSGLDPESRRSLWDLLLELRKSLTILLTTHFMEEADALGDRIIIMASGKVKCSGSPMFLKNKLGAGHLLRIAKEPHAFKAGDLHAQLKVYYPGAEVINESKGEVVYRLDQGASKLSSDSTLPTLCDNLDQNTSHLGIKSYGISLTTLEDVFLKVAMLNEANDKTTQNDSDAALFELNSILNYTKLSGLALTFQRLKGLFFKRFHFAKRYYKVILFTIVLPVFFIIFSFMVASNAISIVDDENSNYPEPLKLNGKSIYGDIKAVVRSNQNSTTNKFLAAYLEVNKEMGIETTFINASLSLDFYFTEHDSSQFIRSHIFGLIENQNSSQTGFKIWHNPFAAVSLPLAIDAYTNAFIRNSGETKQSRITTIYKSMPNRITLEPKTKAMIARVIIALFASFAFSFLSGSYFLVPAIEAQNKSNLIQKMSGISTPLFWLSHYAFDIVYHFIVSLIIIGSIIIIDKFLFINFFILASVFLILILFGLSTIPLAYLFTFLPFTPDAGFSLISIISLVGTTIGSVLCTLFILLDRLNPKYVAFGYLYPPFTVTLGFSKIYARSTHYQQCFDAQACTNGNKYSRLICCDQRGRIVEYNPFQWEDGGILTEIVMFIVDALVYMIILIVLDMNLNRFGYLLEIVKRMFRSFKVSDVTEDDDVVKEKHSIEAIHAHSGSFHREGLVVYNLTKDFGSFRAVDRLCFAVHPKECFGLLGVNGAGKTTTFRMLTGDLVPSDGDAYIKQFSMKNNLTNFQRSISYCPQYDALIGNLTPSETLTLFARLRGMPEYKVKANVKYIIQSTDLTKFARTLNENLSGGNKRKLSLAIAAIGKPEVIFLDEPTTGVDPASRRKIWSTLIYLRESSGSAIVLTSHSMDECETLCSRIGIMANGKLKCLGSSQHLKQKFGQGFTLIVKLNSVGAASEKETDKIKKFIAEKFPSSVLRDHHQTILHYHITDTSSRWGDMLRTMGEAKQTLDIEDFTLSGTTLEQIFLSFAKQA